MQNLLLLYYGNLILCSAGLPLKAWCCRKSRVVSLHKQSLRPVGYQAVLPVCRPTVRTSLSMVIKRNITYLSSALVLLAQVLLAVTAIAVPAQAQTPVGHWTFDDGSGTKAADSSGNGHTATLVNGISWVTGKTGDAVSANAAKRQYVSIPKIDLSGTNAVTVALWANRTYSTNGGHALFEATTNYTNSITGFGFFPDDAT